MGMREAFEEIDDPGDLLIDCDGGGDREETDEGVEAVERGLEGSSFLGVGRRVVTGRRVLPLLPVREILRTTAVGYSCRRALCLFELIELIVFNVLVLVVLVSLWSLCLLIMICWFSTGGGFLGEDGGRGSVGHLLTLLTFSCTGFEERALLQVVVFGLLGAEDR